MKIAQVQVEILNVIYFKKKTLNEKKRIDELLEDSSVNLYYMNRLSNEYLNMFDNLLMSLSNLHQMYPLSFMSEVEFTFNTLSYTKMELVKEDGDINVVKRMLSEMGNFLNSSFDEEISNLADTYSKLTKYKITKDMVKNHTSNLYHSLKLSYAVETINRGSIHGRTAHRHWDDGKRLKDNHPDYYNSYWMKGISFSRDLEYALNWSDVLLIFDKNSMKSNSIEPFSWHNHFSNTTLSPKTEREEFLLLSKHKKTYKNKENPDWAKEYQDAMNEDTSRLSKEDQEEYQSYLDQLTKEGEKTDLTALKSAEGEFSFSESDSLIGFVIKDSVLEIYGVNNENVQALINHPKFIGILSSK